MGAQNIISFGLDVNTFDATKKATLNEFITLFDKLSKYDGKVINPVMGTGLNQFNQSVAETKKLIDELNAGISKLGNTFNNHSSSASKAANANKRVTDSSLKDAEAQTRVAAAYASTAEKAAKANSAMATAAQQAVNLAQNTDKATVAVLSLQSAQESVAAAQRQQAAAQDYKAAALKQYDVAGERLEIANTSGDAAAQAQARQDMAKATVEVEKAEQKLIDSKIASTNASKQLESAESTRLNTNAAISKEVLETDKESIETLHKRATSSRQVEQAALREAEAKHKSNEEDVASTTGSKQKVALDKAIISAKQVNTAAEKLYAAAVTESIIANERLAVAERNVAAAANKSKAERKLANAELVRAQKGANDAAIAISNANATIENTSRRTSDILGQAGNSTTAIANGLTKGLSLMRTIAYILPGLGIAGIFNLIGEAIGNVVDEMGLFQNKQIKQLELDKKYLEGLNAQITALEEIKKLRNEIFQASDPLSSSLKTAEASAESAYGNSYIDDARNRLEIAKVRLEESKKNTVNVLTETDADFDRSRIIAEENIQDYISQQRDIEAIILRQKQLLARKEGVDRQQLATSKEMITRGSDPFVDTEVLEARVAVNEELLKITKQTTQNMIAEFKAITDARKEQKDAEASLDKILFDEERKKKLDIAKAVADRQIQESEREFNSMAAGLNEKIEAINKKTTADIYKLRAEREFIQTDRESTNEDGTYTQSAKGQIATINEKIYDLEKDSQDKIIKLREQYAQRYLTANKDITNQEIQTIADKNLKILENETLTLEDRLDGLRNYFEERQQIVRNNTSRELAETEKANVKNDATVNEEIREIKKRGEEEILRVQSTAENKSYEITKTSLEREFKLIKQNNKIDEDNDKLHFAEKLKILNDAFFQRKIKYQEFSKEIQRLDYEETIHGFDKSIDANLKDLENLKQFSRGTLEPKIEKSYEDLENRKKSGDTSVKNLREISILEGEITALEDRLTEVEVEIKTKTDELDKNILGREKARAGFTDIEEDEEDGRQDFWQAIMAAEQAVYQAIRQIEEDNYQAKLARMEQEKQMIDERYGYEMAAIERSSLDAKEKNALEVQLTAQKIAREKQLIREQKKLAHDKAVFDRDLAIAHITIGTALAIVSNLKTSIPTAVAAGVIGAAALATALATDIPSYAEGVENKAKGSVSLFGEAGPELVKEPGLKPYIVTEPTLKYLPAGTDVIPIKRMADFENGYEKPDYSWEQTRYLAKEFRKHSTAPNVKVIIKNNSEWQSYKSKTLYGR